MRFQFVLCCCLLFVASAVSQTYNYYFGNLHAHTAFSDGNKDSLSSGVAGPDGSYAYAKLSHDLDFLGISEHNHYNASHNPGFKLPCYQAGLNMANAANQDGIFAALFGMEYGVSSTYHGHVIIYGFNQLIGWESNVGGQSGNNYSIFNAKDDYDGLFRKVKNNSVSFAYLAHPYWSDFSKNNSDTAALAFSAYNAMYDSAIVGMPLRSGKAFSTFATYSDYAADDYFSYYKKMLYLGYHLGIGYDHDNHYTNFGRSNGGRLVILAPSLTRANIISAMQQMHFYGSDDSNAKIEFSMNGHIMGSQMNGNYYPSFTLLHNDADGEQADTLRIWRGNRNSGGLWAQPVQMVLHNNTLSFTDRNIMPGIEYYYFADIKQADGQWIVTSPIWYTASGNLAVKGNNCELSFTCFPDPSRGALHLGFDEPDEHTVQLHDVSGRVVLETTLHDKSAEINLPGLQAGVYLLRVRGKEGQALKKILLY